MTLFAAICAGCSGFVAALAQNQFTNLDFESARTEPWIGDPHVVATSNLLAGWTAYLGPNDTLLEYALLDDLQLGGESLSIHDSASKIRQPIQGNYSLVFQVFGTPNEAVSRIAIAQSGQVPLAARSLVFRADKALIVSFKGSLLPVFDVGGQPNYRVYAADISGFAGQVGELRFTATLEKVPGLTILDAIRFSPLAVPEPGALELLGAGGGLLWMIGRKKSQRTQNRKAG